MSILTPPDYSKINKTRRSRGYNFENKIVGYFNMGDWQARRLGGSSVGLPDIVITNNVKSILVSMEAKSTVGKYCYIPQDQITRCNEVLKIFGIYDKLRIVFAFKFGNALKKGRIKYYFYVLNYIHEDISDLHTIRCDSEGMIKTISHIPNKEYKFIPYYCYRCDSIDDLKVDLIHTK